MSKMYTIKCKYCNKEFEARQYDRIFCSYDCSLNWRNINMSSLLGNKKCAVCGTEFKPKSGVHKFCSESCKGKWKYLVDPNATDKQYKCISGNWKRYLTRLLYSGGRKRDGLNIDILLSILKKQDYRCALSGEPLTCNLDIGTKFFTNATVDRIIPGSKGGKYNEENIQLVCRGLNSFRSDMDIDDFVELCRKVAEYNGKKIT